MQEFLNEVEQGKKMNSPAIVRVFGITKIEETVLAVFEFCSNGSLLTYLKSQRGKNKNNQQKTKRKIIYFRAFSHNIGQNCV